MPENPAYAHLAAPLLLPLLLLLHCRSPQVLLPPPAQQTQQPAVGQLQQLHLVSRFSMHSISKLAMVLMEPAISDLK
jgi:hypothetical protein